MDDVFPSSLRTIGLFTGYDELLTHDPIKHTLYPNLAVSKSSIFTQFRFKLWFDELPVMYKLSQRFPGLYADDFLYPICGIFMETLKHLFICSPSYLDIEGYNFTLPTQKDISTNLIERFLVKLATKVSSSPRYKQSYDELLMALHALPIFGLPDLLSSNNYLSFSAFWFLRGTFLKLQREIYHGLWRLRCKIKVTKDLAKGILPSTLRSYKGSAVQTFRFSAPQVTLSQANGPLSPLQAYEWFSLGIKNKKNFTADATTNSVKPWYPTVHTHVPYEAFGRFSVLSQWSLLYHWGLDGPIDGKVLDAMSL
ncbi:hypothetical protein RhiirA5_407105 [Rhizophagus irregularis]|uniref:Uncharacterized protein n=1 Tax=Rhizophagus irregularis TaxID=588596 RepID=A0A2N0QBI9_9GLOM|nr:hypothetical protein RhiirA5_407105 [Rhizophagus irregularis]